MGQRLTLPGVAGRPPQRAEVADRWQTQILEEKGRKLLGLSLHTKVDAMVAIMNVDELDRLITNLQLRRGALTPTEPPAAPQR